MNNYKMLAVKYLKINKRRSILTVIGAALSVMVIYLILNLAWSNVLYERETIREENDYEIVMLTETEEEILQVLSDENIESAYVGSYFDEDYIEEGSSLHTGKIYKNAVLINTINPYKLEDFYTYFTDTYGIECKLNEELASYYFQDLEGNGVLVIALLLLLITFIFATFGVGIVRNAIQLSTLEQIRDYGNLRCIGASKAELKAFIYIEGLILESMGIAVGLVSGIVASMIIGHFAGFSAGFHLIALIPILICFYGDLYFAMQENAKLVVKITPIEAVRGEYKIKTDKIKLRRRSIFGRIFGVEADYAYKNVMRRPGRFLKTVSTICLGVAAAVATISVSLNINNYKRNVNEMYRYYQLYEFSRDYVWYTSDYVQSIFPKEILESITEKEWILQAKKMYCADTMVVDFGDIYEHLSDEYVSETWEGFQRASYWDYILNAGGKIQKRMVASDSCITCYGYDEEDYARLEEGLISGTTDLSENGILIVNSMITEAMATDYDGAGTEFIQKEITTYEVGDTIDIVNMQRLRELVSDDVTEAEAEALEALMAGEIESTDEYYNAYEIVYDYWQQLIDEGDYKTYTIEGILEYDANHGNDTGFINIVLPLDKYYKLTGTDESMIYGMQYHIDDVSEEISSEWDDFVCEIDDSMPSGANYMDGSAYMYYVSLTTEYSDVLLVALLFAIFIFLMNTLNIFNTTAGNLYLRRREFAQLRVIGVSKKNLMKMVLIESVISWFFADIIGVAVGVTIGYWVLYYFYMLMGVQFSLIWLPIIIVCAASLLLLLSASYFPMRRLQPELAADLTASGE